MRSRSASKVPGRTHRAIALPRVVTFGLNLRVARRYNDLVVPKRHGDFADWIDRVDSPMRAVAERSGALSTFCALGRFAIRFRLLWQRNRPEALEARARGLWGAF